MSNSVPINDKRKNAGNGATVQTTTLPPHPDPNAPPSWATGAPKAAAQPPPAAATQPTALDAAAVASTPLESVRALIDRSAAWPAQGPRQLQVIWMLTHDYQAVDILTNLKDVSPAYLEACRRLLVASSQPAQPPADQPAPPTSTAPAPALPNFDMPMRSVLEHQIRAGRTDDQILTDYAARMPAITRDSLAALRYHMAVPTAQVALPAAFDTPVSQLDAPRVDSSFLGEVPTLAQQQPAVAVHLESHAGATAYDVVKASQGENPWSKIPERAGTQPQQPAPTPAAEASNPKKGPRWSEARRERTKELVQLGKGAEEIAADISMPVEKVTEYLEELGQVAAVSSTSAVASTATHAVEAAVTVEWRKDASPILTDAELDAFGRFAAAAVARAEFESCGTNLVQAMNEEIIEMRLRISAWEKLAAFFPRAR